MKRILLLLAVHTGFTLLAFAGEDHVSPNGKFSVALGRVTGPGPQNHEVCLIDADTDRVLASYDAMARAMEIFWSPDSQYVAVNEDVSHATGHLSIWRMGKNCWKPVQLPDVLRDRVVVDRRTQEKHTEEVIDRFVRKEDAPMVKFWWGAHQPSASRWLNNTDLEIGLGGEASLGEGRILALEQVFVVRFGGDKSKILSHNQVHYDVKPE